MNITVLGIGALGSQVAEKLAKKHHLYLIDRDFVEEKNLHNQPFYCKNDIGKTKIEAALEKINAKGEIQDIGANNISLLGKPDLIICCTDTLENKLLVNEYCKKHKITAIYASAAGTRAMILPVKDKPCFRCLFKDSKENCEINRISTRTAKKVASVVSRITEEIMSDSFAPILIYVNESKETEIHIKPKNCMVCRGKYPLLEGKKKKSYRLCGDTYVLRKKFDFESLHYNGMKRFTNVVHVKDITFFSDGRIFVRAKSEKEAERKFTSLIQSQ